MRLIRARESASLRPGGSGVGKVGLWLRTHGRNWTCHYTTNSTPEASIGGGAQNKILLRSSRMCIQHCLPLFLGLIVSEWVLGTEQIPHINHNACIIWVPVTRSINKLPSPHRVSRIRLKVAT
jgi:hypothetical protein